MSKIPCEHRILKPSQPKGEHIVWDPVMDMACPNKAEKFYKLWTNGTFGVGATCSQTHIHRTKWDAVLAVEISEDEYVRLEAVLAVMES